MKELIKDPSDNVRIVLPGLVISHITNIISFNLVNAIKIIQQKNLIAIMISNILNIQTFVSLQTLLINNRVLLHSKVLETLINHPKNLHKIRNSSLKLPLSLFAKPAISEQFPLIIINFPWTFLITPSLFLFQTRKIVFNKLNLDTHLKVVKNLNQHKNWLSIRILVPKTINQQVVEALIILVNIIKFLIV